MLTFTSNNHNRHSVPLYLLSFALICFFVSYGEAVISYIVPNIVEDYFKNTFSMGLMISFSSVVSYFADIYIGGLMKELSFIHYLWLSIVIVILFACLMILLPTSFALLLGVMIFWAIYYELYGFAKSVYVHRSLNHDQHNTSWALIDAFEGVAYLTAPLLTTNLIVLHKNLPLQFIIGINIIGAVLTFLFWIRFQPRILDKYGQDEQRNLRHQLSIWLLLSKRTWLVLAYSFGMVMLDSTYWTVGAVLTEKIKTIHPLATLIFVVYIVPVLIFSPFARQLAKPFGKKRLAFFAGILAGIAYLSTLWIDIIHQFPLFLIVLGIGSCGVAIGIPQIQGTIEDYCERLGIVANTMVSLSRSIDSLGFIVGPIIAGLAATMFGDGKTFAVMGAGIGMISMVGLVFTPRKIRLPQKQIQEVYSVS